MICKEEDKREKERPNRMLNRDLKIKINPLWKTV